MNTGTYSYQVVDVFTRNPLEGNALAVFPNGTDLDEQTMQSIARELNLSETVFILPANLPGCDARLRIFTPTREMAFAGHPTVGASYVLLQQGMVPPTSERFVLQELVGPIEVRVEMGDRPLIWLTTPRITHGPVYDRAFCARVLGLPPGDLLDYPPQFLSAGNPTIFIPLRSPEAVDRAAPDMAGITELKGSLAEPVCVFVFAPVPEGAYSRMFAPEYGIVEDPATGSSTGPLAAYMIQHNLTPGARFVSEQGTKMKRRSLLHVQIHGHRGADGIEVGGYVTPLVRAELRLG